MLAFIVTLAALLVVSALMNLASALALDIEEAFEPDNTEPAHWLIRLLIGLQAPIMLIFAAYAYPGELWQGIKVTLSIVFTGLASHAYGADDE